MTLALQHRNDYLGNGATSVYPFTFKILQVEDLRVLRRDTAGHETVLVLYIDYTVSAGPWRAGGSITLTAGTLPSGARLVIRRTVPLTQHLDLKNQAAFFPETHEAAFDEARMVDQQLDDVVERAPRLPETLVPASFDPTLPSPVADSALVVNQAGTGWTWRAFVSGVVETVESLADTALTFLPAGTGAVSRTGRSKLRDAVTAKDFGAAGDDATNDAFALTNAITAHAGVIVPLSGADYLVETNVTVPAGKVLRFEAGARLHVAEGATVTIDGTVDAPDGQHIFTGAGHVALTHPQRVPVAWFGVCEANPDNAPAFQTALASVPNGAELLVGDGVFDFGATIAATNRRGLRILGTGQGSFLRWVGDDEGPFFRFGGCFQCEIADLRIEASEASPVTTLIIQEQTTGGGAEPASLMQYRRLLLDGKGHMVRGIYLKGDVVDANNSETSWDGVFVGGYTGEAVLLQGANCFNNCFRDCILSGQRTGDYGIRNAVGAGGLGGHIAVYGGAILGHLVADVHVAVPSVQGVLLDNVYSEGSERCFTSATGLGLTTPLILRGVRWAGDQTSGPADGIVKVGWPGPVVIDACRFGDGGGNFAKTLRINWQPGGLTGHTFAITNTVILGALTAIGDVFNGRRPTHIARVWAQTGDDTGVELTRQMIPNSAVYAGRNAADTADIALIALDASDRTIVGANGELWLRSIDTHKVRLDCGLTFPVPAIPDADLTCLDQYQESAADEWAPAFEGSGGQSGQVYAAQFGYWTKIGKMVFFGLRLTLSDKGTFTGSLRVAPLPFVTDSDSVMIALVRAFGMATNVEHVVAGAGPGGTNQINLLAKLAGSADYAEVTASDITDATSIDVSGHYRANL